jgi:hypothetical protein
LINGINYFFIVLPLDGLGNVIATSSEVIIKPTSTGNQQNQGGGGGGGSSGIGVTMQFNGIGYPNSKVYLLQDAVVRSSVVTDNTGSFSIKLSELTSASYLFSLYGEDKNGNRSPLRLVPTQIGSIGSSINGLLLPPTLVSDKEIVKQGEKIIFSGYSAANAVISVFLGDDGKLLATVISDKNGHYSYALSTNNFAKNGFILRTKASVGGLSSPSSAALNFIVGDNDKNRENKSCQKEDLNCDGGINLVDFSIMLYWVRHSPIPANVDLNNDGIIDLKDFSILIYHWTG